MTWVTVRPFTGVTEAQFVASAPQMLDEPAAVEEPVDERRCRKS